MTNVELHNLKADIERSCRYHARREAFFDLWHKLTMGVSLLAGSSAFAAFFATGASSHQGAPSTIGVYASALVAVLTTANLIIGFSHKARDHQMLYRRFKQLAIQLVDQEIEGSPRYEVIERNRLLIEVDEPPIYRALDASCHNEVVKSLSSDANYIRMHSIPLKRRHKVFMHLIRFSDNDFRPREESAQDRKSAA